MTGQRSAATEPKYSASVAVIRCRKLSGSARPDMPSIPMPPTKPRTVTRPRTTPMTRLASRAAACRGAQASQTIASARWIDVVQRVHREDHQGVGMVPGEVGEAGDGEPRDGDERGRRRRRGRRTAGPAIQAAQAGGGGAGLRGGHELSWCVARSRVALSYRQPGRAAYRRTADQPAHAAGAPGPRRGRGSSRAPPPAGGAARRARRRSAGGRSSSPGRTGSRARAGCSPAPAARCPRPPAPGAARARAG